MASQNEVTLSTIWRPIEEFPAKRHVLPYEKFYACMTFCGWDAEISREDVLTLNLDMDDTQFYSARPRVFSCFGEDLNYAYKPWEINFWLWHQCGDAKQRFFKITHWMDASSLVPPPPKYLIDEFHEKYPLREEEWKRLGEYYEEDEE